MSNIANLNFTQMVSPQAGATGAAPAGNTPSLMEFGSALLSQVPGAAIGFVTGGPVGAGVSIAKGLLGMVVNGTEGSTNREKSADEGKNIPSILTDNPLKTVDDSISALQSALVGLFAQDTAQPVTEGIKVVSEEGLEAAPATQQVASAYSGKTLDAYRAAAGLVKQPDAGSKIDIVADADVKTNVDTITNQQAQPTVEGNAADDMLLNTKTSSTAMDAVVDTLKKQGSLLPGQTENTNGKDTMVSLLGAKENAPDALAESVRRLKNLSALTPLPENISKATTQDGKTETPLDKLASLQSSLTPVKQEVQKLMPKVGDSNTAAASTTDSLKNSNAPSQPVAAIQQASEHTIKVKGTPNQSTDALQAVSDKVDDSVDSLNLPGQVKADATKVPAGQEFASHLHKAALPSPADQVAAKISQLTNGKQHITVELQPESMGRVDVKVQWGNDGNTQITISAERKETLDALKADAGGLQKALADSGIKTDAGTLQFSFKGNEFASGAFGDQKGNGNKNEKSESSKENELKIQASAQENAALARSLHINNLVDLRV